MTDTQTGVKQGRIYEWTLGDRLRASREAVGIKQEAMAEILDVSAATVSNWENGQRRPKNGELELIRRWAEETGFDELWLAGFRISLFPPDASDLNRALDSFPPFAVMGRTAA